MSSHKNKETVVKASHLKDIVIEDDANHLLNQIKNNTNMRPLLDAEVRTDVVQNGASAIDVIMSDLPPERHTDGKTTDQLRPEITVTEADLSKFTRTPALKLGSDGGSNVDELLTAKILEVVNGKGGKGSATKVPIGTLGHHVKPGHIGFFNVKGDVQAVGPGYWRLFGLAKSWTADEKISQARIDQDLFHLIRVGPTERGLALDNGNPILLEPGTHIFKGALYTIQDNVQASQSYINVGNLHLLFVPRDKYALVKDGPRKKILGEGTYRIKSEFFEFNTWADVDSPRVSHGNVHIIRILQGEVGKIFVNEKPYLLPAGVHRITADSVDFKGTTKIDQEVINIGTKTIYRVKDGQIGKIIVDGVHQLQTKVGYHSINSATFSFEGVVDASEMHIKHGPLQRIRVDDAEVGVMYESGQLKILQRGVYSYSKADDVFAGHLSLKELALSLNNGNSFECETSDKQVIEVKAAIRFQITDSEKAITIVGGGKSKSISVEERISRTVHDLAWKLIVDMIRSRQISDIVKVDSDKHDSTGFATEFQTILVKDLREMASDRYGIAVNGVQISKFELKDKNLLDQIKIMAVRTAKNKAEQRALITETEIEVKKQERDAGLRQILARAAAEEARIQAETVATQSKLQADAQAYTEEVAAKAEANRLRIKAEGEKERVQIEANTRRFEAQGKADALKLEAEANARAGKLEAEVEHEKAKAFGGPELKAKVEIARYEAQVIAANLKADSRTIVLPASTGNGGDNSFGHVMQLQLHRKLANEIVDKK